MKITIVGTGYVGLVCGICFAEAGNDVIMVDIDSEKVKMLKNKQLPIYEFGLPKVFERNFKAGRLHFTTDLEALKSQMSYFLHCLRLRARTVTLTYLLFVQWQGKLPTILIPIAFL